MLRFLAANYESWVIPLAVLLGIPVAIFGALFGAAAGSRRSLGTAMFDGMAAATV